MIEEYGYFSVNILNSSRGISSRLSPSNIDWMR
jgi:hypothetical protein